MKGSIDSLFFFKRMSTATDDEQMAAPNTVAVAEDEAAASAIKNYRADGASTDATTDTTAPLTPPPHANGCQRTPRQRMPMQMRPPC